MSFSFPASIPKVRVFIFALIHFDIITFCPIYFESDSTNRSGKVTEEIGVRGKIVSLDNHIDDMEISKAI